MKYLGYLYCLITALFFILPYPKLQAKFVPLSPIVSRFLDDSSILEERKITIPGHPKAFNPSLIPYKGGYLLSFRVKINLSSKIKKKLPRNQPFFIGLLRLDKQWKILSKSIQLLKVPSSYFSYSYTAEDARLFNVGNRIFIFFNDAPLNSSARSNCALYFGELVENRGEFAFLGDVKRLNYCKALKQEKNWSPFVSGDKLYLIYSDQPRVILEADYNIGYCREVARTSFSWFWDWGEIRGGTPAYLVDGKLLTFFHSSIPMNGLENMEKNGRNYLMGAYTFEPTPPFTVCQITSRPLGKITDYVNANHRKVVFPGGMVIEEEKIHVSWGKNDEQIWITSFDRKKLLSSMRPLSKVSKIR